MGRLMTVGARWEWVATGCPNGKRTRLWSEGDLHIITVDDPNAHVTFVDSQGAAARHPIVEVVLETTDRKLASIVFGNLMEGIAT